MYVPLQVVSMGNFIIIIVQEVAAQEKRVYEIAAQFGQAELKDIKKICSVCKFPKKKYSKEAIDLFSLNFYWQFLSILFNDISIYIFS